MKSRFFLVSFLGLVGTSALFAACNRNHVLPTGEEGGAGGAGGAGNPTVVGETCSEVSDCENADADHCAVTCEDVDGEKRCVTTSIDADEDGHGTSACEAAPGDDCDDGDKYSYPGGPALVKSGDAQSGNFVHLTSEGDFFVFRGYPTQSTYGAITAQRIDEEGVPFGEVTTWTTYAAYPMRGISLAVAEKDNPGTVGIVWTSYDVDDAPGASLAEEQIGVSNTLGTTWLEGASYGGGENLAWISDHWSIELSQASCGGYTTFSSGGQVASTSTSGGDSRVLGTTRIVVGRSVSSGCPSGDPALVVRRYPTTGSLNTQIGSDVVLVGNSAAANISASFALAATESGVLIAYRETVNEVPLTFRTMAEDGTWVDEATTFDIDITPRALGVTKNGIFLAGVRKSGATNQLVAQRFTLDRKAIGEPLVLRESTETLYARNVVEAAGIVAVSDSAVYQMLRVNSCAK